MEQRLELLGGKLAGLTPEDLSDRELGVHRYFGLAADLVEDLLRQPRLSAVLVGQTVHGRHRLGLPTPGQEVLRMGELSEWNAGWTTGTRDSPKGF